MDKNVKSLIVRGAVFVIIVAAVFTITNIVTQSIGPVVTDEVAIAQMDDTDAGHVGVRAYSRVGNDARTYGPPILCGLLGLALFYGPVSRLIKGEPKQKEEAQ